MLKAINLFQSTAGNWLRPLHPVAMAFQMPPVPWRCTSFQDLLKRSLGRAEGPRWRWPAALGVNLLLSQQAYSFSADAGQSVPANLARSAGAGCQDTRRVLLTLCRKLKRSRSGGTAAMVQVTSQPAPLPPGFDPPIVALLWLLQPIARERRAQRRKHLSLSESKVPERDGQGPLPITEAQHCDSDQSENSVGGETGC